VQERRMPEVTRNQIIDRMVAMVGAPVPTDPNQAVGRQWIRRQAMDILGTIGQVGVDGKVYATLLKVISTPAEPILARATAADAIGRLNYPQGFKADGKELVVQIASISLQAALEESKRLEQRALKRVEILELNGGLGEFLGPIGPIGHGRGGPGMVGAPPPIFGGPPPGAGVDQGPPIDPLEKRDLDYAKVASRRLRAIVAACYGSLAGVRSSERGLPQFLKTNLEAKKPFDALSPSLRQMAEFLEDDIKDIYLFEEDLKQRSQNLGQALATFVQPVKAADPMPMPMQATPDDPLGGR
jgi:hypothetical protein